MSTAFPDVKPFPAAPAAKAVMGHNKPPLEESVVIDFEEALRSRDGLIARIEELERKADEQVAKAAELQNAENEAAKAEGRKAKTVLLCTTAEKAGRFGDFIKMCSTAAKAVEEEREKLNRPLLTAQRSLKAKSDSYSDRAKAAGEKVRAHLDAFLAEEDRKRRAEEARIAEEQRQREAAAEAERQRLQKLEDEAAERENRNCEKIVVEHRPAFNPLGIGKAPLRGDYGTTVSTTENWKVEVINIRQVPDAYLKHPTVIEALQKVLGPLVRGKNGLREIKGCRIYSELGSSVR